MESLEIIPVSKPIVGRIRPPGSKSITNRALICAALADGESTLTGALDSEDTRVMVNALRRLEIAVTEVASAETLKVYGCSGDIPAARAELYIANSGTSARFLTALVALGHGWFRISGTPRMHGAPLKICLMG